MDNPGTLTTLWIQHTGRPPPQEKPPKKMSNTNPIKTRGGNDSMHDSKVRVRSLSIKITRNTYVKHILLTFSLTSHDKVSTRLMKFCYCGFDRGTAWFFTTNQCCSVPTLHGFESRWGKNENLSAKILKL